MDPDNSDALLIVNSAALSHLRSVLLCNQAMRVISEIRRLRLGMLRDETALSWADLNRRLNRTVTDSTLSQIWHQAPDSKTGRKRQMGDDQARTLEAAFSKPSGWMDRDPMFDELEAEHLALQRKVAEPDAAYKPDWPLLGITPHDWRHTLTGEMRSEVLGIVRGMLLAAKSTHLGNGTSG